MELQKSFYVPDFLEKRADLSPGRVALHEAATGRELTYAEWNARANQAANFLRALGVGVGDRVCVYACNSLDYLDVWQAC
ncbi:MAG: AMP-binding protein, partial [Anaerolineae bacterium]|nr:AMP-binding protein [Anaerolineae bacterium]